jgi:hypothetical protein
MNSTAHAMTFSNKGNLTFALLFCSTSHGITATSLPFLLSYSHFLLTMLEPSRHPHLLFSVIVTKIHTFSPLPTLKIYASPTSSHVTTEHDRSFDRILPHFLFFCYLPSHDVRAFPTTSIPFFFIQNSHFSLYTPKQQAHFLFFSFFYFIPNFSLPFPRYQQWIPLVRQRLVDNKVSGGGGSLGQKRRRRRRVNDQK